MGSVSVRSEQTLRVFRFNVFLGDNFPGDSDGKASARHAGDPGSFPGSGRSPGEGNGNPLQHSCLENPRRRNLIGYSRWGRKESDTTERLHFPLSLGDNCIHTCSVVSDSLRPARLLCSSVLRILQARILEWVAMTSSRESSQPRN